MKHNKFYTDFLTEFEPQFQSVVHGLLEKSEDTEFDAPLISKFLSPVLPYTKEGKRVRPFLIAVGADSLSQQVIDAGIAFELMHTFILVHDDIMDGATLRRNVPTVHEVFNEQHLPGNAGAMLVGDFLSVAANEYMARTVPELMPLFCQMQRFLCVGQFYEMINWGKDVSREISEKIALFKSAQYTFMYPLQHGLQLSHKDIHQFDTYATYAGLAFQVRDDWLDIKGEEYSGKSKDLDSKNSVPNIIQNMRKTYTDDINELEQEVTKLLTEYKSNASSSLESVTMSKPQKDALESLLIFSTSL